MTSRSTRQLSVRKRLAFWMLLVPIVYGAIEGIAFIAYRPITGASFRAAMSDSETANTPDVRHPWPADGMCLHFLVLGLLAFCIRCGLFYRLSATLLRSN